MALNNTADIFVKEKPVLALLAIQSTYSDVYPSKISKRIDSTYAHTVNIISKMESNQLVESRKEGRKRILTLTNRGNEYADVLTEMMEIDGEGIDFPGNQDGLDFLNNDKGHSSGATGDSDESGGSLENKL
jgi:DNA-binding MarR family transcriptional regulator